MCQSYLRLKSVFAALLKCVDYSEASITRASVQHPVLDVSAQRAQFKDVPVQVLAVGFAKAWSLGLEEGEVMATFLGTNWI
jgi:hypothetical protein